MLLHERDGLRALADGRGDPLGRPGTHIAGREHAAARRTEEGCTGRAGIRSGEHEAGPVGGDVAVQPTGLGLCPDEDEHTAGVELPATAVGVPDAHAVQPVTPGQPDELRTGVMRGSRSICSTR